jgi:hypothetical protein
MITTAHKTELERFTESNMIGVDQKKDKKRMTILRELSGFGYVRPSYSHAGFQYFVRTEKQIL